MTTTQQYYLLSELLQDDIYAVCFVIRSFYKKDSSVSVILKHLEMLKLDDYAESIDIALSQPIEVINECVKGITFDSIESYVIYLTGLLRLNNIGFTTFKKKMIEENINQRGLF